MARRDKDKNPYTLNGIRAERLVDVLMKEITNVRSVKDWAEESTTPESSLHRIVKQRYGKTPGNIIKEIRYEKIILLMKKDEEACAYSIALDSGFSSEAALRMFLRRCHGTNIRTLRREILSGKLRMKWTWLNGSG